MSAILAGASLREEIKKIEAAKDQRELPPDEKESDWEDKYLRWVLLGKKEETDTRFIGDEYYELRPEDFIGLEEFLEKLRNSGETTEAGKIRKKFTLALQKRLETKSFAEWLPAALLVEINQLLDRKDLAGINVPST